RFVEDWPLFHVVEVSQELVESASKLAPAEDLQTLESLDLANPAAAGVLPVEPGGLEPRTSWVRSRHRFRPSLPVLQGLSGARCPLAMSADWRSLRSFRSRWGQ